MILRFLLVPVCLIVASAACDQRKVTEPAGVPADVPTDPVSTKNFPTGPIGPLRIGLAADSPPITIEGWKLPAGVQRDSLQEDVEMIRRVRGRMPPAANTKKLFNAWSDDVPTTVPEWARRDGIVDLGFGLKRRELSDEAGYGGCNLTVVFTTDSPLLAELDCQWPSDLDEGVWDKLHAALGSGFDFGSGEDDWRKHRATARFTFPAAQAASHARLARELGPQLEVAIPPQLKAHYETLHSPANDLDVGDACYVGGAVPEGRVAMLALLDAGRVDLLRNILRGPNPEGRLYATEALRDLNDLSAADAKIIKRLATSDIPISLCGGYLVGDVSSAKAFAGDRAPF